jgi:hypothetical protein
VVDAGGSCTYRTADIHHEREKALCVVLATFTEGDRCHLTIKVAIDNEEHHETSVFFTLITVEPPREPSIANVWTRPPRTPQSLSGVATGPMWFACSDAPRSALKGGANAQVQGMSTYWRARIRPRRRRGARALLLPAASRKENP